MTKNVFSILFALFVLTVLLPGCVVNAGGNGSTGSSSTSRPKSIPTTRKTPSIAKPMTMAHRVLAKGDSLQIFIQLTVPRLKRASSFKEFLRDVTMKYGILANYRSREFISTQNLRVTSNTLNKHDANFYFDFTIPKKNIPSEVLLMEVNDGKTGQKLTMDIPLDYIINKIRQTYTIFDGAGRNPIFRNFFLDKANIQVKDLNNTSRSLTVKHYRYDFKAARPPMSVSRRRIQKRLPVDTVFTVQTNTSLKFTTPGLYIVQADTNQYYGLSFIVAQHRYPKYSKIADLINPLRYITTKSELEKLDQSEEKKKDLDRLWLGLMSGNIKTAKRSIREYYRRVKLANQFFTTYKPGWQTDKGMIFIIFGNPTRVVRTRNKEMWTYAQNANFSDINFTFLRTPNQFVDNHYTLVRYPEYEQVWYPKIEQWREGKIGS